MRISAWRGFLAGGLIATALLALGTGDSLLSTNLRDLADVCFLVAHPVVPRAEVGFRVQLTAANTTEQVDHLITVLGEIDDRFGLRRPSRDGQLTSAITSSGMSKLA